MSIGARSARPRARDAGAALVVLALGACAASPAAPVETTSGGGETPAALVPEGTTADDWAFAVEHVPGLAEHAPTPRAVFDPSPIRTEDGTYVLFGNSPVSGAGVPEGCFRHELVLEDGVLVRPVPAEDAEDVDDPTDVSLGPTAHFGRDRSMFHHLWLLTESAPDRLVYGRVVIGMSVHCEPLRSEDGCTDGTTRTCDRCAFHAIEVPSEGTSFGRVSSRVGPVDCSVPCPGDDPELLDRLRGIVTAASLERTSEEPWALFTTEEACRAFFPPAADDE